ncbi:TetR/AcrR family transcriptional regulator [Aestuariispira insulae]|uniref:TetR family transcriptional regulator n=1 Tax=Aestuariispira insulae TaxID=1461337 RepID=A0A3D9HF83_9PROT|nr:TetR/AcrR family transcriptional regulator [Aestuariispira insulae]RED48152.1 TetR family transcriptional regulator [Aestuariispira insulae]
MILNHPGCPIGNTVSKLTRSEAKRQAIVDAARDIFIEKGYGESSMDDIANRANVSKRTVYNHFPGKDALFGSIIEGECDKAMESVAKRMAYCEEDIEGTLREFAARFLDIIYSPDGVKLFRTIVAEADRFPELGTVFFQAGVCPAQFHAQEYIAKMMDQGRLRKDDPEKAATLLFCLIKGDMHYKLLLCFQEEASPEELTALIDDALEMWMRAYAPAS